MRLCVYGLSFNLSHIQPGFRRSRVKKGIIWIRLLPPALCEALKWWCDFWSLLPWLLLAAEHVHVSMYEERQKKNGIWNSKFKTTHLEAQQAAE